MGDGLPLLPSLSCWTHPQSPGEGETRMVSRQPIAERARRADLDVNRRRARPAPYVEREVPYCQVWPQLTTGVAQPGRQSQRPRPSADAHPPAWAHYGCVSLLADGPSEPGQHLGERPVRPTSDHAGFTVDCDERHVGLEEGPSDERRCPDDLRVWPHWAVDVTNERPRS
jgi:hypothetical protein